MMILKHYPHKNYCNDETSLHVHKLNCEISNIASEITKFPKTLREVGFYSRKASFVSKMS